MTFSQFLWQRAGLLWRWNENNTNLLGGTKHETEKAVEALDPRCSIHDFRMVNGEKQINLIFDFVIPREYSEEKGNELTLTLMDRLQHHNPKYQCVITLDRSYVEEQR